MKESKYYYNGKPLSKYCKDNNININTIHARIWKKKQSKKYENYSEQEIVDMVIQAYGSAIKYMYKGISLRQYCLDNGINLRTIHSRIENLRKKNENLSNDELVILAMEKFDNQNFRFFYKGVPLKKYCESHPEINYNTIRAYINREKEKNPELSNEELIKQYLDKEHKGIYKYYYKGIPLKDYAEQNDLNAGSIRHTILKKQLRSNKPLQEIIDECVESYQKFSIKYYYNGIPLLTYCNSIGLNYYTIIQKYLYEYVDKTDIGIDEAIKQIVDYYIEHPPIKTKYYFNDQSLRRFCDTNGYPYLAILRRIKALESKDDSLDNEQIIALAIKKYEDRLQIDKINEIFDKLKNSKICDVNEIKNICEFLKIDFENVTDLVNMDFSYNQAINMIWHFSDKKTSNDYKIITDKKIKDIFILIDNLRSSNKNIEQFELYDLIGIYKSELYDSRNEILLRQKRYIYKTMYSLCSSYEVKVNNSNYEDFENEIKYYLLMVINRTNLNIYGKIIKYMDLTVKGYFRTYLKKYRKQNNSLSLDDAKYSSYKDTRREKSRIDYIADSKNPYDKAENTSFSSNMMKVLSSLSPEDLSFIMLKYQENYSNDELVSHFNLTLDEIEQKEIEILSLLKNNDNVKVLRKTKNDN